MSRLLERVSFPLISLTTLLLLYPVMPLLSSIKLLIYTHIFPNKLALFPLCPGASTLGMIILLFPVVPCWCAIHFCFLECWIWHSFEQMFPNEILNIRQISFTAWKYIVFFAVAGNEDKHYFTVAWSLMFMTCDSLAEYDTNSTPLLNIPCHYLRSTGCVFQKHFSTGILTAFFCL